MCLRLTCLSGPCVCKCVCGLNSLPVAVFSQLVNGALAMRPSRRSPSASVLGAPRSSDRVSRTNNRSPEKHGSGRAQIIYQHALIRVNTLISPSPPVHRHAATVERHGTEPVTEQPNDRLKWRTTARMTMVRVVIAPSVSKTHFLLKFTWYYEAGFMSEEEKHSSWLWNLRRLRLKCRRHI